MVRMTSYTLRPLPKIDADNLTRYAPLTKRLLLSRNIQTEKEAEIFLHPDWERDTHDPFLMHGMKKTVERIFSAIEKNEPIAIWSDYDMDGIPGAVVLYDFFRTIGYENVVHHTPHRNIDGFGLNKDGIDDLIQKKVGLIITVDCGTADAEHITYAKKNTVDVIVTDHHLVGDTEPEAFAILNPKQDSCTYPEQMLCGAGVAFKLVQALVRHVKTTEQKNIQQIPVGWEKWMLDMVGMATIADMVPLRGENRTFAHFGIVVLQKSRRLGLQALLKKARTNQRYVFEEDVAFSIAPRINAASRMGHARDAFTLLASTDVSEAGVLAEELEKINTERKTVVATMKREVNRRLKKMGERKSVIVLGNPDWKPSLLGLVAGSLAEEYECPVFLWGREEGVTIKGSCRSYGSCNIFELMEHARDHFSEYGGHRVAGGFSVKEGQVHTLEDALVLAFDAVSQASVADTKHYDDELTLENVNWNTYREVALFGPFGEGNSKPLFLFKDVMLDEVRMFGKGNEHIELTFKKENGSPVKAICFFKTAESFSVQFQSQSKISFVAHMEASYFKGRPELRLKLVDVVSVHA